LTTQSNTQTFRPARPLAGACLCVGGILLATSTWSQTGIFRCPGRPAVYTTDARTAASQNCRLASTEIMQSPLITSLAERTTARPAAAQSAAVVADETPTSTVNRTPARATPKVLQTERESDRHAILQSELSREQERLAQLKAKAGPARTAASGGLAIDAQLGETQLAIRRSESDIAALVRELNRTMR
jgi:hypothetical protein